MASLFKGLTTAATGGGQLGGRGGGAQLCSQVLCVSHNPAFQQLCGHVVQLARDSSGHTALATAPTRAGPVAAGGGALPPKRTRKA